MSNSPFGPGEELEMELRDELRALCDKFGIGYDLSHFKKQEKTIHELKEQVKGLQNALERVLGDLKQVVVASGGTVIVEPDDRIPEVLASKDVNVVEGTINRVFTVKEKL